MIEPSDNERANLPDCTREYLRYLEDMCVALEAALMEAVGWNWLADDADDDIPREVLDQINAVIPDLVTPAQEDGQ